MVSILCLDTSTTICSVSLGCDGKLMSFRESDEKNSHSRLLNQLIQEVLSVSGLTFSDIDAIAVGSGPGSYTGLRIGISTAKGLCYALDKPLISMTSLQTLAAGMIRDFSERNPVNQPVLFVPMIDARRMEVFTAVYNPDLSLFRNITAEIVSESSFSDLPDGFVVVFGGDGSLKCKNTLKSVNAFYSDVLYPNAAWMIQHSFNRFEEREFENMPYFEPFYLKDFIAGVPRVKGLS